MFQSYSLELAGNVFAPPQPERTPYDDLGGQPFWEALNDDF
jgi:hypothetical protein